MNYKDKNINHYYICIQCLIFLAFLFWIIGTEEGRVIVRRANKLGIIIQIRSKIWTWACNFAEEMENTHTYLTNRRKSRQPEL